MPTKDEFLKRVREAVSRGDRREPGAPSLPLSGPSPNEVAAHAEQVLRQAVERRQESIATLLRMAPLQAWNVTLVANREEAARAVADIAATLGARLAVRSDHPALNGAALDRALAARGVETQLMASDAASATSPRVLREQAARADLGITGVEFMVAETATAVLLFGKGHARATSLLPPVHVAVVEADQVVPTLADALALCQAQAAAQGWRAFAVSLVSGPSRTGDIEQTIVVGVHGPREVYLVLIGGP